MTGKLCARRVQAEERFKRLKNVRTEILTIQGHVDKLKEEQAS